MKHSSDTSGRSWARHGRWAVIAAVAIGEVLTVNADTPLAPQAGPPIQVQVTPPELSGCAVVDGGILVVEDEVIGAVLFAPAPIVPPLNMTTVKLERRKKDRAPFTDKFKLFPVQDFEDIASDRLETVFFIGSHKGKDGKRNPDREFLIRAEWKQKDGELKVVGENYRLLEALNKALAAAGVDLGLTREDVNDSLNVEGLALHDDRLFIGLRAPLSAGGKAIVCTGSAEALGRGGSTPIEITELDLDGGGVRALDWDPVRNVLLVLSGPSEDGDSAPAALWTCNPDGTGLTRVLRFDAATARKQPEGICRLPKESGGKLLVVLDGEDRATGSEVLLLDW
jgi:hypothetical protein